jgi:gliding motility associated protien GldN
MAYSKKSFFISLIMVVALYHDAPAQKKSDTSHTIPWAEIKPDDILWKKRVWRQINVYEKNNAPMSNDPRIPKENVLANIILYGLHVGAITAYREEDTAFTAPISIQEIDSIIRCDASGLSTYSRAMINGAAHPQNSIFDTTAVASCVFPEQVAFYNIIEDWMFDRGAEQMIVRIQAIAPAVSANGKSLFWLHYRDSRKYFDQNEVYNGNKKMNLDWDEYFESRQFSSKITKINPTIKSSSEPVKEKRHRGRKYKKDDDSTGGHDIWVY